jgi:hypothetical protein
LYDTPLLPIHVESYISIIRIWYKRLCVTYLYYQWKLSEAELVALASLFTPDLFFNDELK